MNLHNPAHRGDEMISVADEVVVLLSLLESRRMTQRRISVSFRSLVQPAD